MNPLVFDEDAIKDTANTISSINDDCDTLKTQIKQGIEGDLRESCKGEIAEEFVNYFNTQIYPNLTAQIDIMAETARTLNNSGGSLGDSKREVIGMIKN